MKMQVTSLAVFLFATLATSSAQSSAAVTSAQSTSAVTGAQNTKAGMETTFSGDGETEECTTECANGGTCSVIDGNSICNCLPGFSGDTCQTDICMDNECQNGATCIRIEGDYNCQCSSGYEGKFCDKKVSCSEQTVSVPESAISNVDSCNETYTAGAGSGTITLDFPSADAGSWSQANQNCNASCVVPGSITQPMAIARCNASGSFEIEITNCSAGADDLTPQEQLPYAIVASEPSTATPEEVEYAITITTDFTSTGTPITATEAGQTIDIYNNLLQVEDANSQNTVNEQSDEILDSIDDLSRAVVTTAITRAADREFVDIDSNIALAVVEISGDGDATFAANADLGSVSDLTTAGLRLDYTTPGSGSYVSVTGSGDFRISFRAYITSDVLFRNFPADVVLQKTVLSASIVNGSISDGEYIFNFENIGLSARNTGNCQRWDRVSQLWIDGGCIASWTGNAVQCSCTQPGAYVAVATVITEEGLSPGAIAGIVIGSVVGAALIGGGIYYFAVVKKKKANSIHMEMDEADDAVPKAAAPKAAAPKAEVPEVTDTESRTEA